MTLFRFWVLLIILVPIALITALSLSSRTIPFLGVDFYALMYVAFLLFFLWLLFSPVVLLRYFKKIKSSKFGSSGQSGLNLDKVLRISMVSFLISFPLLLFSIYLYSSYYLDDTGVSHRTLVPFFAGLTTILAFICLLMFVVIVSSFIIKLKRLVFKPKVQNHQVVDNSQTNPPVKPILPQTP